jgi:electron transfer flavoprotein alpha subunit
MSLIWVHGETTGDRPSSITLELISKARTLADTVEVWFSGENPDAFAAAVGEFGASKVYAVDPAGTLPAIPEASAIKAAIDGGTTPDLIFFGSTYDGRDVLARLAVALDQPVITNAYDIEVSGDEVTLKEQIFGGSTIVSTTFRGNQPHLALFRPKSFPAEPGGSGSATVENVAAPQAGTAKVIQRHVEERTGPQLDEAPIVVAGGRGLGEADKYEMIEQLAKLLKGAPGASRAIVDAGWVPYSYQVGQTGKVVKPDIYIACGISGATQHMVGMKGSKNIIAINKDQDAPIFGIADLGIVGDVHKVLPALIEALQKR